MIWATHQHRFSPNSLACLYKASHPTLHSQANDLLDWCQHLKFGDYASEWTQMACTLASEADVPGPEPAALFARALPPPHHNLQVSKKEAFPFYF